MNKNIKETYLIPFILVFISIIISTFTNNFIFSFITISSGILNGWYAAVGKWYNYLFGIVFNFLNAYVCFKSGLYGIFIFSCILYIPLQITGLFSWYKKTGSNNKIKVRSFNTKTSLLITIICFFGSISLGYILSKVPSQSLAFLDATSNIINVCAFILMNLRFKEAWRVMLGNNIIDLTIWILNFYLKTPNSFIMLLVSISYLILNVIGLIKWERKKR